MTTSAHFGNCAGAFGPATGDRAKEHFTAGFNCAESVFLAGAEALGRSEPGVIPAIATTFGGGMHLDGGFCGALTGALMAIGLAVGRQDAADREKKDLGTRLGMEFGALFRETYGHLLCSELTGCRFTVPEEVARWRAGTGRQTICAPMVERTADQVVAFLKEHGLPRREG